jgi:hypothetical protein
MTDRLKNDVIFVNINGCLDWIDPSTQLNCVNRLNKTTNVQKYLSHYLGLRSYRLNPIDGDITYMPFFNVNITSNFYTYQTFILFELYNVLEKYNINYTHLITYQHDGFVTNVDMWSDTFLEYDYIGHKTPDDRIMNSGFSIRTKSLMKTITDTLTLDEYQRYFQKNGHGNDDAIYHDMGFVKETPPQSLIDKFVSSEPSSGSFGFHTNKEFDFNQATSLWNVTV